MAGSKYSDGHKLITCILHMGGAKQAMEALRNEYGITTASFNSARGVGKSLPLALRGIGEQTEKEILNVIVEDSQAEDVFAFLFEETGIDQPHGGLIYMHGLQHSLPFYLPDLSEEATSKSRSKPRPGKTGSSSLNEALPE